MARFNDIVHDSFLMAVLSLTLRLMVRFSEVYRYSLSKYTGTYRPLGQFSL